MAIVVEYINNKRYIHDGKEGEIAGDRRERKEGGEEKGWEGTGRPKSTGAPH